MQTRIRTRASQRRKRKAAQDAIVRAVARGSLEEPAARQNGIHPQNHWRWRRLDHEYRSRIEKARAAAVRRIKATVLACMRDGLSMMETSKIAGRTTATLLTWRREDAVFDGKVQVQLKKQRKERARKRAEEKKAKTKKKR